MRSVDGGTPPKPAGETPALPSFLRPGYGLDLAFIICLMVQSAGCGWKSRGPISRKSKRHSPMKTPEVEQNCKRGKTLARRSRDGQ